MDKRTINKNAPRENPGSIYKSDYKKYYFMSVIFLVKETFSVLPVASILYT